MNVWLATRNSTLQPYLSPFGVCERYSAWPFAFKTLSVPSADCSSFWIRICTFVLAKQVKRVPVSRTSRTQEDEVSKLKKIFLYVEFFYFTF